MTQGSQEMKCYGQFHLLPFIYMQHRDFTSESANFHVFSSAKYRFLNESRIAISLFSAKYVGNVQSRAKFLIFFFIYLCISVSSLPLCTHTHTLYCSLHLQHSKKQKNYITSQKVQYATGHCTGTVLQDTKRNISHLQFVRLVKQQGKSAERTG